MMAGPSFCVMFFVVFALGAVVVSSQSPRELNMQVSPTELLEGLTTDMTINCTFLPHAGTAFSTLMSIILNKEDTSASQGLSAFKEIAAVIASDRYTPVINDDMGANVTGQLLATGLSYLAFQWTNPTDEVTGNYSCNVHGMDAFGHPVVETALAEITETKKDNHTFLHDFLMDKINALEKRLDDQSVQLNDQKVQLTAQQTQIDDVFDRLNGSRDAIVEYSAIFGGHHYYISRALWSNVPHKDSLCRLYGGYLVEIDSQDEFDFLSSFLGNTAATEYVYIGGTQEGHPGNWTYQRSGDFLPYFNWGQGQGDEADDVAVPRYNQQHQSHSVAKDCVILMPGDDWKMGNHKCMDEKWDRFLCEIPY